jgi:predicted transcriptional regulator of viral defense system
MRHVIEIWQANAASNAAEIIALIDERAAPINKVRAGFLLEAILQDPGRIVRSWQEFAQRGGSRKLDPTAPYKNKFSEKWMLSLNV